MNKNQNNNLDKFKAQKMKIFLGTNVLLRELTPFMGRGKSFEDLLTIGICGILRALEECNSLDGFDEKIKEYAKLYLSKYIKDSDYCPKLMDIAIDILINNIDTAETLKLGNSIQKFAKQKIDSLAQQHKNKPLVLRKAVYVSLRLRFMLKYFNYKKGVKKMKTRSSFNIIFHVLCGLLFLSWAINWGTAMVRESDYRLSIVCFELFFIFLVIRNLKLLYLIFTQNQSKLYLIQGYWKDSDDVLKNGRVVCADELENTKFPADYAEVNIFHYGLTEKKIKQAIAAGHDSEYEWVITSYRSLL